MTAPAVVRVDGVTRRYGRRAALVDVSFAVGPGALCAVVGRNGAGKTTLMRLLAGLLDADRGTITIAGVDVAAAPRRAARGRGYLGEGAPAPPELGVREYLRFRAQLRGCDQADLDQRLTAVGLAARARDPIATLSKGQRQRLAWAEALLGDPAVLLLDEPASGLDEAERAAVRARLADGRGQRAVVWASHELADVEAVADQVIVLVDGRVAAAGDLAAVRRAAGVAATAPLRDAVAALEPEAP